MCALYYHCQIFSYMLVFGSCVLALGTFTLLVAVFYLYVCNILVSLTANDASFMTYLILNHSRFGWCTSVIMLAFSIW